MLRRFIANADTTITNAFKANLTSSGQYSNMGLSDSLETFYIYQQANSTSEEKARILVNFDISDIIAKRAASDIPASGACVWHLKMFNAQHPFNLPKNFKLEVFPVTTAWAEGFGLDMEEYEDLDAANWISASLLNPWTASGGDINAAVQYTASFAIGNENLLLNVSDVVEKWIDGSYTKDGFLVRMSASCESGSTSFYTKKFFARGSEFFYKRPTLECLWNDSKKDNRVNFVVSSSMLPAADNLNTLYFRNKVRGKLVNIPGSNPIYVKFYADSLGKDQLTTTPGATLTASYVSTGLYSVTGACYTTASTIYDIWDFGGTYFYTGTIKIRDLETDTYNYVVSMPNLKSVYKTGEEPVLRVFSRKRDWHPTVYTKATAEVVPDVINDLYYKISRVTDDWPVVDFDTSHGSTKLSYDLTGSYFVIDMNLFEPGYQYMIEYLYTENDNTYKLKDTFKFRVEE